MEKDVQRSVSLRPNRRADRSNQSSHSKDIEGGFFSPGRLPQDYPMKIVWKKGFIRLVLVGGILWMLLILVASLFHLWSCHSSISFFSAMCNKESKLFSLMDNMGFTPKSQPQHRCQIPLAKDPDKIVIPKGRTPDTIVKNLSYVIEDEPLNNNFQSTPLFGGHQSWSQREESFKLKPTMKVHCGFIRNGGAEMAPADIKYVKKCRFVVASGIFDGYDVPHQPSNISPRSKKLFCFLMVVDEISLDFIKENVTVREDDKGGKWVGIWRLIPLKHPPYDEPRRNGKVPKIITHRLFPKAQYSIWIDGKMELIVDPLLMLERYLWRGKYTFAIAQHKHHHSIYEEADANKRRKRYARPLLDLHMKIYRYEGMDSWSPQKKTISDVPEGAIIVREHTEMSNLFSCLWFNEVNLFTPRDQLSFGYVVYRLKGLFEFFMFPNCEYNSLFVLHPHIREHSSRIEWVTNWNQLKGNGTISNKGKDWDQASGKNGNLIESRGGLGLWTPYPGNLDSVALPPVTRTSKAG
ncbi:probable hexosyltransferase MUCI70 isoform X1 [Ziziphus jujuba]|uniref:Probable hexosyltransferase MUCI70 isoform X1 n=1 Tax=Ziziphus jujuba TaxID=326968 RepID=A0ABM3IVG2_ZIZJJ|nr:probable hexosyltransferase MUCI70 isoform X1 [Ziziphus jujuba]XP_048336156.2 probable hexosyltransferase MUCI70 isoform X1 [Ziziphus jujuba]XP_048336157.2 probable hexosyltransferase MUCI70 isoform X1 [Ziziphus jujuba]XP_048336158.2 probable hexosyltransferase MUCI70 isoform X1 [Ziziphus jujuba]